MRTRLLVSAYTGLVIYLVTMFFFGGTGHYAYQNLRRQTDILEKNIQNLSTVGQELAYSVVALKSDSDSIVMAGRRLLLLQKGEGLIRVAGYRERPKALSPGGIVVLNKEADILRLEPFLRAFALVGGVVVFLLYKPRRRTGGRFEAKAARSL